MSELWKILLKNKKSWLKKRLHKKKGLGGKIKNGNKPQENISDNITQGTEGIEGKNITKSNNNNKRVQLTGTRQDDYVVYNPVIPRKSYYQAPLMCETIYAPVPTMSLIPCYPLFSNRNYRYPWLNWNSLITTYTPSLYSVPMAVPVCPPILTPSPYPAMLSALMPPIYSPLLSDPYSLSPIGTYASYTDTSMSYDASIEQNASYIGTEDADTSYIEQNENYVQNYENNVQYEENNVQYEENNVQNEENNVQNEQNVQSEDKSNKTDEKDPLEMLLTVPRDLFPPARMIVYDTNLIIDEFCKLRDILNHASWLMDLEYGVPRRPDTRPIAIYDALSKSIRCKNTPLAIHPGFESCNEDFKRTIVDYYDVIVSTWYRSYMSLRRDSSVAGYQLWLKAPMHVFGMCWP